MCSVFEVTMTDINHQHITKMCCQVAFLIFAVSLFD